MNPIDRIEAEQLRKEVPPFKPGDTVRVHVRVVEGDKERIQVFEGTVIGRKGGASRETFTVRKTSYGVGVERTFPVHSLRIDRIEIVARGVGSAWTTLHIMFEQEAAALLGIPPTVTQAALLPVAYYTGGEFKPAKRLPARERTHWNAWARR